MYGINIIFGMAYKGRILLLIITQIDIKRCQKSADGNPYFLVGITTCNINFFLLLRHTASANPI